MVFFIRLLGYVQSVLKRGGSGGPPPVPRKIFYRIRYKIRQFYAFLDTSDDIYQCCHYKRVDGIYVIYTI